MYILVHAYDWIQAHGPKADWMFVLKHVVVLLKHVVSLGPKYDWLMIMGPYLIGWFEWAQI